MNARLTDSSDPADAAESSGAISKIDIAILALLAAVRKIRVPSCINNTYFCGYRELEEPVRPAIVEARFSFDLQCVESALRLSSCRLSNTRPVDVYPSLASLLVPSASSERGVLALLFTRSVW